MPKNKSLGNSIKKRADRIQRELTDWAHDELLLGFGQSIHVTIEIREGSSIDIELAEDPYDQVLSQTDWEVVLSASWNAHPKRSERVFPIIRSLSAACEEGVELETGSVGNYNSFLKQLSLPYRLKSVGSSINYGMRYYGLFGKK